MNKKKAIATVVASLGIASVVGVGTVVAQSENNTNLAEQIAIKFNLNKDDVQKVIDENHEARHAERQKTAEERLQEAVDTGKLTSGQKDKIIAKMKELESNREVKREEMKNKTEEERRSVMKAEREELQKWAEENDIPTEYMMFGGRDHRPDGPSGRHGDGPSPDAPNQNE